MQFLADFRGRMLHERRDLRFEFIEIVLELVGSLLEVLKRIPIHLRALFPPVRSVVLDQADITLREHPIRIERLAQVIRRISGDLVKLRQVRTTLTRLRHPVFGIAPLLVDLLLHAMLEKICASRHGLKATKLVASILRKVCLLLFRQEIQ
ncbi:hypothetical protein BLA18110_07983 [Burkholderia lata]|nr:hypothetical protein BLA18110_07983 [Burkholderia lata]